MYVPQNRRQVDFQIKRDYFLIGLQSRIMYVNHTFVLLSDHFSSSNRHLACRQKEL